MEDDFVEATSDNLPRVDPFMLMHFASTCEDYVSAEIRNVKSNRSMRGAYVDSAVGNVCLKRNGDICIIKGEVCPEHRQSVKNYKVQVIVDEENEEIQKAQCLSCTASEGGCKHALAFLMFVFNKSNQPSPTEVECYWVKPKLTRVSANQVLRIADLGCLKSTKEVNVDYLRTMACLPAAPMSSFKRYQTPIDEVSSLDLHNLCIRFVSLKGKNGSFTPAEFRVFCRQHVSEKACDAALKATKDQRDSRQWQLLRYGRISASTIHDASRSKIPTGGVLKEKILGATTLRLTGAMKRGLDLELSVLKVVCKQLKIKVQSVGLQICPQYPEFGASPDGLCSAAVVEIKCPSSVSTFKNYINDNNVVGPEYISQMQLQMKLCKKSKAYFCVARPDFEVTKNVVIVTVNFDSDYVDRLMSKASAYWEKHIFPVLLKSAREFFV